MSRATQGPTLGVGHPRESRAPPTAGGALAAANAEEFLPRFGYRLVALKVVLRRPGAPASDRTKHLGDFAGVALYDNDRQLATFASASRRT